jgi:hypothetical protein
MATRYDGLTTRLARIKEQLDRLAATARAGGPPGEGLALVSAPRARRASRGNASPQVPRRRATRPGWR